MTRHIKMMALAILAVAMATSPCMLAFPEGVQRCQMGDCDEPQIGGQTSCCCASPASPARSADAASTVSNGRTPLQKEWGNVALLNQVPAGRLTAAITADSHVAPAATAGSPDLFLLHSAFLI